MLNKFNGSVGIHFKSVFTLEGIVVEENSFFDRTLVGATNDTVK